MKTRLMLFSAIAAGLMLLIGQASAQTTGDFQTAQSGNWNDVNTWASWNGSAWVTPVASVPSGTGHVITILSGNTITMAADVSVDSVFVAGTLVVNSGVTFTLPAPAGTERGIVVNTGGNVTINGTFNYARNGGNGSGIPTATWGTGSTCLITGVTSTVPSNANQGFYNFTVNSSGWSGSYNFGWGGSDTVGVGTWTPTTIYGNVSVYNTGSGRWQLEAPTAGTQTQHHSALTKIMGNLVIDGTTSGVTVTVTASGSSNAFVDDSVNVYGNVVVTGDPANASLTNFSISRGSIGNTNIANNPGSATWNLYGDLAMSNCYTQNSDTTSKQGKFVFTKSGTQSASFTNVTFNSTKFNLAVNAGSTLLCNTPIHCYSLLLNGIISSSSTNPFIVGYLNGSGSLQVSNDNPIVGGSSTAYVSGPMGFMIASASTKTYTLPVGKNGAYRPVTLKLSQTATTASTYTAEMVLGNANALNSVLSTDLNHVSSVEYYDIVEASGGSAFTAGAVTLNYGIQGVDDKVWDPGATRVVQGPTSAGTWVDLGPSNSSSPMGSSQTGTITSTVAFTDLMTNTVFALGSTTAGVDNPLPVEMTSFTGTSSASSGITLHWTMASELNNSGWDVQRATVDASGNVSEFTKIGHVKGSLNSVTTTNYSFVDRTALYGTYEYRLNQLDINGNNKFSDPIKIAQLVLPKTLELGSYPNPFNPTATLQYALPEGGRVVLTIYNSIGQMVTTLVNRDMDAGIFETSFNASALPSGMYFARLSVTGSVKNSVVITKLLLIK